MSTRANVKFVSGGEELWFYRHSDGYPSCCGEDLKDFVKGYASGKLRSNLIQSAGHLVVRGHEEFKREGFSESGLFSWKVGTYEPTTFQHTDIEFLYEIDLDEGLLSCTDLYSGDVKELARW